MLAARMIAGVLYRVSAGGSVLVARRRGAAAGCLRARQPHPRVARVPRRSDPRRCAANKPRSGDEHRRALLTSTDSYDFRYSCGPAPAVARQGIHHHRRADAGALHRRQHRALFRRPQRSAAAAAGARVRADRADGQRLSGRRCRGRRRRLTPACPTTTIGCARPTSSRSRRSTTAPTRASIRTARRCASG